MEATITIEGNVLFGGHRTVEVRCAPDMFRDLYPYQSDIIDNHLLRHHYTLTEAPTGSGKSRFWYLS